MPISYTPLILVIKDIENNRLSSYNRVEKEIKQNEMIKTNDKKYFDVPVFALFNSFNPLFDLTCSKYGFTILKNLCLFLELFCS